MRKESEIVRTVAEQCLITPRQLKEILSKLRDIVYSDVIDTGKSRFPILGIAVQTKVKGSTPARMGRNPFSGEEVMISAKPPKRALKIRFLSKSKRTILDQIEVLYGPPAEPEKTSNEPNENEEETSS